eukprot:s5269_g1.t1
MCLYFAHADAFPSAWRPRGVNLRATDVLPSRMQIAGGVPKPTVYPPVISHVASWEIPEPNGDAWWKRVALFGYADQNSSLVQPSIASPGVRSAHFGTVTSLGHRPAVNRLGRHDENIATSAVRQGLGQPVGLVEAKTVKASSDSASGEDSLEKWLRSLDGEGVMMKYSEALHREFNSISELSAAIVDPNAKGL